MDAVDSGHRLPASGSLGRGVLAIDSASVLPFSPLASEGDCDTSLLPKKVVRSQ